MTMRHTVGLLLLSTMLAFFQKPVAVKRAVLARDYREGEQLAYAMKGINTGWPYEIQASAVVKKNPDGKYFEEYSWSQFTSKGVQVPLSPASMSFRQHLSLAPDSPPGVPNLSQIDHKLVGPVTDLLTFYVDLFLANVSGQLNHSGDHFYFKNGTPSSWADGTYVLVGEDSIDFDLTLSEVNDAEGTATLIVRHVPPQQPGIKLPVEWMRQPVRDTPNNWVEIKKSEDGKYIAAVGKETFDVRMKVSLANGRIVSATMDNPVDAVQRVCDDADLTKCKGPEPYAVRRKVEISLLK